MVTYRISGALGWLLSLAAICNVTLAAPSTGHGYESKSFAQAYLECLQYLNISRQSMYGYDTTAVPSNKGGNCLLRCIGLNTRWWNDETGLNEKALVRFFRQSNANSLDQARTCLAKISDSSDTCAAAYWSFRCYSDALGEVIAHPEYIVPRREEIQRAVIDCAAMLQVSDEQLTSCVDAETFQRSDNTTVLLRCVVLRLGLYADSTGVMYGRLKLSMDSDTALSWTEAHIEEAKQCENDLRALGADVCLVAAHSVEICYGWQAFGELWKVLKEEYASSDNAILYDHPEEPLMVNDAAEEKQEQQKNNIYRVPKEVEVFSYPSGSRYRSLLILNPNWNVDDSKSDSSDSSSSQDEKTSSDDKLATHELSEIYSQKSANSDNAVKQQTMPEPEERRQPETDHVVHTRSVVYPMAPELFPCYRPVLPPYALRMRRSIPLVHFLPHGMPVMDSHSLHPMHHPIVKRYIPMEPMFVPVHRPFVPARVVRDVDSRDSPVASGDRPLPDFEVNESVVPSGQQDELVALNSGDSTVSKNEELRMVGSSDGEDSLRNIANEGEGGAYEESNPFDRDSTVTKNEKLRIEGPSNVEDASSNMANAGEGAAYEESNLFDGDYSVTKNEELAMEASCDDEDSLRNTANEGEGTAYEESNLFDGDSTVTKNEKLRMEGPSNDEDSSRNIANAGEGGALEEPDVPAPNEDTPEYVADETLNDGVEANDETDQITDAVEENVGDTFTNENSNSNQEEVETAVSGQEALQDPKSSPSSSDKAVHPKLTRPSLPEGTDQSPQLPTSDTLVSDDSKAPTPKAINSVQRLIRAVRTANFVKNLLSTLTKH